MGMPNIKGKQPYWKFNVYVYAYMEVSQICHKPVYYVLLITDPTFMRVESQ